MSSNETVILFTQSQQPKYQDIFAEFASQYTCTLLWKPFVSLVPISSSISSISTEHVLISSSKTLDYLNYSLLNGKKIHVIGEGTAQILREHNISVTSVQSSIHNVSLPTPSTFLGALEPTVETQKRIKQGALIHVPIYQRIEHLDHILPKQIEWVVFLSPSAVRIWFEHYENCLQNSESIETRYVVIGETTKTMVQQYDKEISMMPAKPNFRDLLVDLKQLVS